MDAITLDLLLDSKRLQETFRSVMQEIATPQLVALEGVIGDESRPFAVRRMAERLRDILAEILRMQGFSLPGLNQSRPDPDTSAMALRQLMTKILTDVDWPIDTADKMVTAMTSGDHRAIIGIALQTYLGTFTALLAEQPQAILERGL